MLSHSLCYEVALLSIFPLPPAIANNYR